MEDDLFRDLSVLGFSNDRIGILVSYMTFHNFKDPDGTHKEYVHIIDDSGIIMLLADSEDYEINDLSIIKPFLSGDYRILPVGLPGDPVAGSDIISMAGWVLTSIDGEWMNRRKKEISDLVDMRADEFMDNFFDIIAKKLHSYMGKETREGEVRVDLEIILSVDGKKRYKKYLSIKPGLYEYEKNCPKNNILSSFIWDSVAYLV